MKVRKEKYFERFQNTQNKPANSMKKQEQVVSTNKKLNIEKWEEVSSHFPIVSSHYFFFYISQYLINGLTMNLK